MKKTPEFLCYQCGVIPFLGDSSSLHLDQCISWLRRMGWINAGINKDYEIPRAEMQNIRRAIPLLGHISSS